VPEETDGFVTLRAGGVSSKGRILGLTEAQQRGVFTLAGGRVVTMSSKHSDLAAHLGRGISRGEDGRGVRSAGSELDLK
jgi:hypothetical protein